MSAASVGLPSSMAFDDVIQHLDTTRVVAVITERPDGRAVATPIWSVVIDGVPYVRSAFGSGSKWFQHALSGRGIRFSLADGAIAERDKDAALAQPSEQVRVEQVAEDDAVQVAISDVLATKYADAPEDVAPTVSAEALAATLRVLPA